MHSVNSVQSPKEHQAQGMQDLRVVPWRQELLRAEQVRQMLGVDRSTVYRMAETGRLPAVKVGKQWRFRAQDIERMLEVNGSGAAPGVPLAPGVPPSGVPLVPEGPGRAELEASLRSAWPVLETAAQILGVMLVVTDMVGQPVATVINPCPWFRDHASDPDMLAACLTDWRQLAEDPDLGIGFRAGPLGFDCARVFVRLGSRLIGMLIAGGVAATDDEPREVYRLSAEGRARVLAALPIVAARVSSLAAGLGPDLNASETRSVT